jgi:hypothetical protein
MIAGIAHEPLRQRVLAVFQWSGRDSHELRLGYHLIGFPVRQLIEPADKDVISRVVARAEVERDRFVEPFILHNQVIRICVAGSFDKSNLPEITPIVRFHAVPEDPGEASATA